MILLVDHAQSLNAAEGAAEWLNKMSPAIVDQQLVDQGLALVEVIRGRQPLAEQVRHGRLRLPDFEHLFFMARDRIMRLSDSVCSLDKLGSIAGCSWWNQRGLYLGALALSLARDGDLVVVSGVLRLAVKLGAEHEWLSEAYSYLLRQQGDEGYFGLIRTDLRRLGAEDRWRSLVLAITIDVLRTISVVLANPIRPEGREGMDVSGAR